MHYTSRNSLKVYMATIYQLTCTAQLFTSIVIADNYEVGVHIADVSYFVKPDTALDRVASQRATSTYLVHKVSMHGLYTFGICVTASHTSVTQHGRGYIDIIRKTFYKQSSLHGVSTKEVQLGMSGRCICATLAWLGCYSHSPSGPCRVQGHAVYFFAMC